MVILKIKLSAIGHSSAGIDFLKSHYGLRLTSDSLIGELEVEESAAEEMIKTFECYRAVESVIVVDDLMSVSIEVMGNVKRTQEYLIATYGTPMVCDMTFNESYLSFFWRDVNQLKARSMIEWCWARPEIGSIQLLKRDGDNSAKPVGVV